MDQSQTRGVMNELLYPIDGAPDLSDAVASRLVKNVLEGRLYSSTPEEFAAAIKQTLGDGKLDPQTVRISHKYDESDLLAFLDRVGEKLFKYLRHTEPRDRCLH